MYFHKTPKILEWLYPAYTWHRSRKEKKVYLTFDDGPVPNATDFVLDTLQSMDVKASFFCVGDNVRKHQTTFEKVLAGGHVVGNHSFNHLNGWGTENIPYFHNIRNCAHLVKSSLFRPPYGRLMPKQLFHRLEKLKC